MIVQSARNVSTQTHASKVPRADERAGFQSIQSAVQHGANAAGAVTSSLMLQEVAGRLEGMRLLAAVSIGIGLLGVPLVAALERRVRAAGSR